MNRADKVPPWSMTTAMALLRSLSAPLFDPYRPELHYMRGPGPKWREKHGMTPAPAGLPASLPVTA